MHLPYYWGCCHPWTKKAPTSFKDLANAQEWDLPWKLAKGWVTMAPWHPLNTKNPPTSLLTPKYSKTNTMSFRSSLLHKNTRNDKQENWQPFVKVFSYMLPLEMRWLMCDINDTQWWWVKLLGGVNYKLKGGVGWCNCLKMRWGGVGLWGKENLRSEAPMKYRTSHQHSCHLFIMTRLDPHDHSILVPTHPIPLS